MLDGSRDDVLEVLVIQYVGGPHRGRSPVQFGEPFEKLEAVYCLFHSRSVSDGAMVLHHGRVASLQRLDDIGGQLLGAKACIRRRARCSPQLQAAVVEWRQLIMTTRQRSGRHGM